ncbi:MAG: zf-HC2 domain-containing protein [Myxococcota bacterium]
MSESKPFAGAHPSDGMLQAYFDQELPTEQHAAIRAHVEGCVQCRQFLEGLDEQHNRMSKMWNSLDFCLPSQVSPSDIVRAWQKGSLTPEATSTPFTPKGLPDSVRTFFEHFRARTWTWSGLVGLCGIMLALILKPSGSETPPYASKETKLVAKGTMFRMLYSKPKSNGRGYTKTHVLKDGMILSPRDLVQFTYTLPYEAHLMIVGLNREGEVFPVLTKQQSSLVQPAGTMVYPQAGSFTMDDYLGEEKYFLFVQKAAFSFQQIRRLLKKRYKRAQGRLQSIRFPKGQLVLDLYLRKRVRGRESQ